MKNKLLNKYLLPCYITSVVFLLMAAAGAELSRSDSKIAKTIFQEDICFPKSDSAYLLISLLILASGFLGLFGLINTPITAKKQTEEITKQYIKELLQNNPEIQKYSDILNNEQSLKYIAAIACNNLSTKEQNSILVLINYTFNALDKSDFAMQQNIVMFHTGVLNIVKKHAKSDPEYVNNIIRAIEYSHNTYIFAQQLEKSR